MGISKNLSVVLFPISSSPRVLNYLIYTLWFISSTKVSKVVKLFIDPITCVINRNPIESESINELIPVKYKA